MLDATFPTEWRPVRLEDVAEVRTGLAKGKKDVKDPVRRPYLRVANVQDGHLDLREIKLITVASAEVDRYTLTEGDILLTEGGDADKLGRGTMWRNEVPDCLHQNHVFVVRVQRDQLLPEYLAWMTNSPHGREYFRRCSKQSTNLASINTRQLRRYPLVLPSIVEQRGIARVLRTADRSINLAQALLKGRRKLKRGLLQQLLTGQRRFPEFRKQPWIDVPIGELLREEERYVNWSDDEEYRLVSVRRRSGGFFDRERKRGRDILTKTLKVTHSGDFVLARMQVLHGAMTVTPRDYDGAHVSDSYMTFVSKDYTRLHMPYFGYLSSTRLMYHKALISSVGVAIEKMSFNPRWWLAERVHIPASLEEQRKIAGVLQACDRELELLRTLHDALKEQKKGLMQKLLTGQVRVPASMLKEAAHA